MQTIHTRTIIKLYKKFQQYGPCFRFVFTYLSVFYDYVYIYLIVVTVLLSVGNFMCCECFHLWWRKIKIDKRKDLNKIQGGENIFQKMINAHLLLLGTEEYVVLKM